MKRRQLVRRVLLVHVVIGIFVACQALSQTLSPQLPLKGARTVSVNAHAERLSQTACRLDTNALETSALYILQQTRLRVVKQSDLDLQITVDGTPISKDGRVVGCSVEVMVELLTTITGNTSYGVSYVGPVTLQTWAQPVSGLLEVFPKKIADVVEEEVKTFAVEWGKQNP